MLILKYNGLIQTNADLNVCEMSQPRLMFKVKLYIIFSWECVMKPCCSLGSGSLVVFSIVYK